MDRLAYRDDTGRARLTRYGMQMYCSTQATADCFAKLEESIPRWIPVKERLPKTGEYVLVRYKNNDMAVACVFDSDENVTFWRAQTDEGWCADCDTEPSHWMPLPEPPKEE